MYDLLITNGRVIDGTGNPWFRANVGVKGKRVVRVARQLARTSSDGERIARRTINANGLVVCPGFIDLHTHSDLIFALPPKRQAELLEGKILQGVTTELIGNCGLGPAPIDNKSRPAIQASLDFLSPHDVEWRWETMGDYLDLLEKQGVAINVAALVSYGAIKAAATARTCRSSLPVCVRTRTGRQSPTVTTTPSQKCYELMDAFIHESMEAGAYGMSFGLIYPPGQYAATDELIRLSKTVADCGGFAAFHQRSGSTLLRESIQELIQIAREAQIPVHHSHDHTLGKEHWRKVEDIIAQEEEARASGIDITADVIPYTSVCTTMLAIYPPWALTDGVPGLLAKLTDNRTREEIRLDIENLTPTWPPWKKGSWPTNIVQDVGWGNIHVSFVGKEENKVHEMKSITEIADMTGKEPFDAVSDIVLDEGGAVTQLIFGVSGDRETDDPLTLLLSHPHRSIVTDAWDIGRGAPHPGAYGCFPRVLGKYVRHEGIMQLEEAIRKMTSLPAQRLGIQDRGVIRDGAYADIVIFDPDRVIDKATYRQPRLKPEGIEYVTVNGSVAAEGGSLTSVNDAGAVLRRTV